MIKFVLICILSLALIGWFGINRLDAANDRISELVLSNENLATVATANTTVINQLKSDLESERATNVTRAATKAERDQSTKEKIKHVESNDGKGWYGDSVPKSVVCLLTEGVQAQDSDGNRVCEESSAARVAEPNTRTEVKNEDHTTLTLELQSALDSCNADKADVTKWIGDK